MEEFLKTVAKHYKEKSITEARSKGVPASLPLSKCLFCFPNRRSSLFFSRHLRAAFGEACCLPSFTTISELFGLFNTRQVANRTTLLFRLFQVYDRLSTRKERESFDQFVFWGDMLLSDFDDVDKYMVDADRIFSNVRDLKEIEARFAGFTPEQIEVIKSFWIHFRADKEYSEDDKHEVFGQTWAILADLYHEFRKSLAEENLAYEGMMEREVIEQLYAAQEADETIDPFAEILYFDKVEFVGLTAVSEVDRRLLSLLKLHGRAEFCWDYADPRLHAQGSKATSAAFFTRRNLMDFANELSDEELANGLVPEEQRQIDLYAVASGVGQTQQAREVLMQWRKLPHFDPLRTAVVLPDEKLLLPMLYAVPRELDSFNVTMGYGLRNTPVHAFISMVAQLQQSWRKESSTFYFRQVLPLLSHSFTLGIAGREARKLNKQIVEGNLYQIPVQIFSSHPFLALLFRPICGAQETLTYLLELLSALMERAAKDIELHAPEAEDSQGQQQLIFDVDSSLQSCENSSLLGDSSPDSLLFTDTDYEFLYHYRKTILQLEKEVLQHAISFESRTLFQLLDKLVAGVSVPFSGEPLQGLQLMGVLETRSLDFDNVIILSMNEGVFPAKPVQNTFVPMSLRDAFGMPTQRHRDSVFAYHFYRLIGRATRVALIYDSRTEGMQSGEESRYVKQLRFLMGREDLLPKTKGSDIGIPTAQGFSVRKTPEVMAELEQCLQGKGKRSLSASVLKRYIECPLKFYLSFVRQLREDEEVSEGVDSMIFGNILHEAMCSLYSKCENQVVEASMLETYIKHPEREVSKAIQTAFANEMNIEQPEGYNLLISQILTNYAVETLRHDMKLCPFRYVAGERKQVFVYHASAQLNVRVICIFDRLDRSITGEAETLRIVDYKTGNSNHGNKLLFSEVSDLFSPGSKGSEEAFQVMLYSLLLRQAPAETLAEMRIPAPPASIAPHLYFVRDFHPHSQVSTNLCLKSGRSSQPIYDVAPYLDELNEHLQKMLCEIFNPEVPFTQCEDPKSCTYCPFQNLCKRITN